MHPYRGIVCTYIQLDGLSMRPNDQNTLTCQSSNTNDAPRDLLHDPIIGIRYRVSVFIHYVFLPKSRIRYITDLIIFDFHCIQHIIYQSINQILIRKTSVCCIWTIWSGLYQTGNTIVTRSTDKEIITGREFLRKDQVFILSGRGHTVPHLGEISLNIIRPWTSLYPFLGHKVIDNFSLMGSME